MVKRGQQRSLGGSSTALAKAPEPPDSNAIASEPETRTPPVRETSDNAQLASLLRKRARRFSGVLAAVLGQQTPESVHDLRVWSRRLQQTLSALFPNSQSNRIRSIRRKLRKSRRALGAWRNCDVVLQKLERKQRRSRNQDRKRAWSLVIDSVRKERRREIRQARKRLARLELFDLNEQIETLLKAPAVSRDSAGHSPSATVSQARAQWLEALTAALEAKQTEAVHQFRIQTKRLRYRIELLRDLGVPNTAASLDWLRSLQDELGTWHDRLEVVHFIAEAVAAPDILRDQARASIILLTELEKQKKLASAELDHLLREASDSPQRAHFDAWAAAHDTPPPIEQAASETVLPEGDNPAVIQPRAQAE